MEKVMVKGKEMRWELRWGLGKRLELVMQWDLGRVLRLVKVLE